MINLSRGFAANLCTWITLLIKTHVGEKTVSQGRPPSTLFSFGLLFSGRLKSNCRSHLVDSLRLGVTCCPKIGSVIIHEEGVFTSVDSADLLEQTPTSRHYLPTSSALCCGGVFPPELSCRLVFDSVLLLSFMVLRVFWGIHLSSVRGRSLRVHLWTSADL